MLFLVRGTGKLWAKQGISVFVDLFSRFEVLLIAPVVLELALDRRIVSADLWSRLVDSAPVIVLEVFARGVNQQVPVVVVNEYRGAVVQQIPTHEVEVSAIDRLVDRQRKIVAALCGAVFAKICVVGKLASSSFGRRCDRGHKRGSRLYEWEPNS